MNYTSNIETCSLLHALYLKKYIAWRSLDYCFSFATLGLMGCDEQGGVTLKLLGCFLPQIIGRQLGEKFSPSHYWDSNPCTQMIVPIGYDIMWDYKLILCYSRIIKKSSNRFLIINISRILIVIYQRIK